ncbi:MAG: Bacteriohemerythrin [Spirochaetes bacterium ADurb.Bin218]|jgi:hemerythrin-like metal-binding protein|nr:hemerythrin family protein [Spirochaetota bacterium]OQA97871.1 MAG: Bacteriohemerythrin [Spirochaetes bacterium ADurb.Bin218]HOQ12790.1 bacteriohemerythrin [Spirochaetota bacterium]HPX90830.1 bacteriohemerythrin [Spirochaetota bacterium]
MQWESRLSIGIKQFDEHHKELIRIIAELRNSKNSGESHVYLKNLLFELLSYTKYHFTAEERMMEKHHYPEFEKHKKEHVELTEQVEYFLDRYSLGKTDLDEEIFEFLKKWLFEHILETDKKMGEYLHIRGVE